MSTKPLDLPRAAAVRSFGSAMDALAKSILFRKLTGLRRGTLVMEEAGETRLFGAGEPRVRFIVNRPSFYTRAALGGSIGVGEGYAEGDWDTDDLPGLARLFVENRGTLEALDSGWGGVIRPLEKLWHWSRRNTVDGARANIRAHYDLGNDFFQLFLDETLMYSCAIFGHDGVSLADASRAKNDRICRSLRLGPQDHVLEIGTGWGGFAIHAAGLYGCRVTTTTISRAQYDLAKERIARAGLADKVTLLLEDYRDLRGQYDKLVSIEMVEAIGLDNLDTYFRACADRLTDAGAMMLQSIVIHERFYAAAQKSVDFIQKHIFPGSGIPSVASLVGAAAKSHLRLLRQEDFGTHYARTLRAWSERLALKKEEMIALGYSERLYRLWQFYFAYCQGGFDARSIGLVQALFTKEGCRLEPAL